MVLMMPVSSWGAYIITLMGGLLASIIRSEYTPIGMSSMNFYAISPLFGVFVAYFSFDIASMVRHEN